MNVEDLFVRSRNGNFLTPPDLTMEEVKMAYLTYHLRYAPGKSRQARVRSTARSGSA